MDRWREQARRDPTQPACRHHLSDRELDDHLPSLLAMLADTFSNVATTELEAEGAKHGHQRRMLNYTVGEVLGELHTFREVILAAVDRFNLASNGLAADQQASIRLRLLRLLDRSFTA